MRRSFDSTSSAWQIQCQRPPKTKTVIAGAFANAGPRLARYVLDSRFIFVPAEAPAGTVDWLVIHMVPKETIMLDDDGARLAAADRFTLERRQAGNTPVLRYRAKLS